MLSATEKVHDNHYMAQTVTTSIH